MNYKRFAVLCWLVIAGLSIASKGAPVNRDQALRAATRWHALAPSPMRVHAGKIGKVKSYYNAAGEARFHVVDLEPSGFVVVACR